MLCGRDSVSPEDTIDMLVPALPIVIAPALAALIPMPVALPVVAGSAPEVGD